jgi:PAS domain S-box-containing protein
MGESWEIKMPHKKPAPAETSPSREERAHLDNLLDEALSESFPASESMAIQFEDEMFPDSVVDLSGTLAEAVLSSRSDAIVAADKNGIIRFWNPGAERIFGFRSAEAVGQSLDIIIPERLRRRHWDGYDHAMTTGRSRYGEGDVLAVPALRNGGGQVSIEFTVVLLRARSGTLLGIAAILRDVTKRFEEIRALKRQVGSIRAQDENRQEPAG